VFAIVDGVEARHWKPGKNPVPHFGHLLLSREEMREAVLTHKWVFPRLADAIVDYIYDSPAINRTFYDEYVKYFETSPFRIRQLVPVREHVPARVLAELRSRCRGHDEFGIRMVEVVLEKP
jgi:hypothetical protein